MTRGMIDKIKTIIEEEMSKEADKIISAMKQEFEQNMLKKKAQIIASLIKNVDVFVKDAPEHCQTAVHINYGGVWYDR